MKSFRPFYFLIEALKSLKRNGVMTLASVAVLMSCLIVIGGFSLLVYNIDVNLEQFGEMNKIAVFCQFDASEDEISGLKSTIEQLDNVKEVVRHTKEERLKTFQEEHVDAYGDITSEENPLSDSLEITYKSTDTQKISNLTYELEKLKGEGQIRKISNRYTLSKKIDNFKNTVMMIFIWFLAILLVVSVFIIVNTIKLALVSRKREIGIMRYIGATKWFITLPFIIEGMLIGLVAGTLAFFIIKIVYNTVVVRSFNVATFITIAKFSTIEPVMVIGFLLIGVVTGVVGSFISLVKYLNT